MTSKSALRHKNTLLETSVQKSNIVNIVPWLEHTPLCAEELAMEEDKCTICTAIMLSGFHESWHYWLSPFEHIQLVKVAERNLLELCLVKLVL